MDKTPPPARSASPFGLRRAKVVFFTYPVPFLTNDKCEAPYENTALSLDKINTPPAGSTSPFGLRRAISRV